MKQYWEQLSAKNRRLIVVGAALGVFVIGFNVFGGDNERERRDRGEDTTIRHVLTDRDTADVRLERIVGQLENIRDENRDLNRALERVNRDLARMERGELGDRLNEELAAIQQQIQQLEQQASQAPDESEGREASDRDRGAERRERLARDGEDEQAAAPEPAAQEPEPEISRLDRLAQEDEPMWQDGGMARSRMPGESSEEGESSSGGIEIRTVRSERAAEEKAAEAEEQDDGVYLPAGSIMTGTLITGLDAPTGTRARQDPFPALLRLKHEAILPNRFRADIRECFVIVGGYGDLSSERAFLRGETISCVREDGGVVESRIDSYTVGEDGKAGVRGRLVSKQGQMLARALMAGAMESFSSAFGSTPVPSIDISGDSRTVYQQAFSSDALQSAGVSGVGKAMDRLAEFYIEQAEGMFPVIEVDAGREVDIVLVRGGQLSIQ